MTFKRWLPTFLAFPLGGLIAIETVGSLDGPLSRGARRADRRGRDRRGSVAGAAQRSGRWIAYTAIAMSAGTALATALTHAGTDLADLAARPG